MSTTVPDYIKGISPTLLHQGAEARIYSTTLNNQECFVKERFAKLYRIPELDQKLRKKQLKSETKSLEMCLKNDIPTPLVMDIDINNAVIYLTKLPGCTVREYIESLGKLNDEKNVKKIAFLAKKIGTTIARLHNIGVIHGDLTTSNMIIDISQVDFDNQEEGDDEEKRAFFMIDFGLSQVSENIEERAVDLYVLERAIETTHANSEKLIELALQSYVDTLNKCSMKVPSTPSTPNEPSTPSDLQSPQPTDGEVKATVDPAQEAILKQREAAKIERAQKKMAAKVRRDNIVTLQGNAVLTRLIEEQRQPRQFDIDFNKITKCPQGKIGSDCSTTLTLKNPPTVGITSDTRLVFSYPTRSKNPISKIGVINGDLTDILIAASLSPNNSINQNGNIIINNIMKNIHPVAIESKLAFSASLVELTAWISGGIDNNGLTTTLPLFLPSFPSYDDTQSVESQAPSHIKISTIIILSDSGTYNTFNVNFLNNHPKIMTFSFPSTIFPQPQCTSPLDLPILLSPNQFWCSSCANINGQGSVVGTDNNEIFGPNCSTIVNSHLSQPTIGSPSLLTLSGDILTSYNDWTLYLCPKLTPFDSTGDDCDNTIDYIITKYDTTLQNWILSDPLQSFIHVQNYGQYYPIFKHPQSQLNFKLLNQLISFGSLINIRNVNFKPIAYNRHTPLTFDLFMSSPSTTPQSSFSLSKYPLPTPSSTSSTTNPPLQGWGWKLGTIILSSGTLVWSTKMPIVSCTATYTTNSPNTPWSIPDNTKHMIKLVPTTPSTIWPASTAKIPPSLENLTVPDDIYTRFDVYWLFEQPQVITSLSHTRSLHNLNIMCSPQIRYQALTTANSNTAQVTVVWNWLALSSDYWANGSMRHTFFIPTPSQTPSLLPSITYHSSSFSPTEGLIVSAKFTPPVNPDQWPTGCGPALDEWNIVDPIAIIDPPQSFHSAVIPSPSPSSTYHMIRLAQDEGWDEHGMPCVNEAGRVVGHFYLKTAGLKPISISITTERSNTVTKSVNSGVIYATEPCVYTFRLSPSWYNDAFLTNNPTFSTLETTQTPHRLLNTNGSGFFGVNYRPITQIPFITPYPNGMGAVDSMITRKMESGNNMKPLIELQIDPTISSSVPTWGQINNIALKTRFTAIIHLEPGRADTKDIVMCYWGRSINDAETGFKTDYFQEFATFDPSLHYNSAGFSCAPSSVTEDDINAQFNAGVYNSRMKLQIYSNDRKCLRFSPVIANIPQVGTFHCRFTLPIPFAQDTMGIPIITFHHSPVENTIYPIDTTRLDVFTPISTTNNYLLDIRILDAADRWVALPPLLPPFDQLTTIQKMYFVSHQRDVLWKSDLTNSNSQDKSSTMMRETTWSSNKYLSTTVDKHPVLKEPVVLPCPEMGVLDGYISCYRARYYIEVTNPMMMPVIFIPQGRRDPDPTNVNSLESTLVYNAGRYTFYSDKSFSTPILKRTMNDVLNFRPKEYTVPSNEIYYQATLSQLYFRTWFPQQQFMIPLYDVDNPHKTLFSAQQLVFFEVIYPLKYNITQGLIWSLQALVLPLYEARATRADLLQFENGGTVVYTNQNLTPLAPVHQKIYWSVSNHYRNRHFYTADWAQLSSIPYTNSGPHRRHTDSSIVDTKTVPGDVLDAIQQFVREQCLLEFGSTSNASCLVNFEDRLEMIDLLRKSSHAVFIYDDTAFSTSTTVGRLSTGQSTRLKSNLAQSSFSSDLWSHDYIPSKIAPHRGRNRALRISLQIRGDDDVVKAERISDKMTAFLKSIFTYVPSKTMTSDTPFQHCVTSISESYFSPVCGTTCSPLDCKLVYNQPSLGSIAHARPPSNISSPLRYRPGQYIRWNTGTGGWSINYPLSFDKLAIKRDLLSVDYPHYQHTDQISIPLKMGYPNLLTRMSPPLTAASLSSPLTITTTTAYELYPSVIQLPTIDARPYFNLDRLPTRKHFVNLRNSNPTQNTARGVLDSVTRLYQTPGQPYRYNDHEHSECYLTGNSFFSATSTNRLLLDTCPLLNPMIYCQGKRYNHSSYGQIQFCGCNDNQWDSKCSTTASTKPPYLIGLPPPMDYDTTMIRTSYTNEFIQFRMKYTALSILTPSGVNSLSWPVQWPLPDTFIHTQPFPYLKSWDIPTILPNTFPSTPLHNRGDVLIVSPSYDSDVGRTFDLQLEPLPIDTCVTTCLMVPQILQPYPNDQPLSFFSRLNNIVWAYMRPTFTQEGILRTSYGQAMTPGSATGTYGVELVMVHPSVRATPIMVIKDIVNTKVKSLQFEFEFNDRIYSTMSLSSIAVYIIDINTKVTESISAQKEFLVWSGMAIADKVFAIPQHNNCKSFEITIPIGTDIALIDEPTVKCGRTSTLFDNIHVKLEENNRNLYQFSFISGSSQDQYDCNKNNGNIRSSLIYHLSHELGALLLRVVPNLNSQRIDFMVPLTAKCETILNPQQQPQQVITIVFTFDIQKLPKRPTYQEMSVITLEQFNSHIMLRQWSDTVLGVDQVSSKLIMTGFSIIKSPPIISTSSTIPNLSLLPIDISKDPVLYPWNVQSHLYLHPLTDTTVLNLVNVLASTSIDFNQSTDNSHIYSPDRTINYSWPLSTQSTSIGQLTLSLNDKYYYGNQPIITSSNTVIDDYASIGIAYQINTGALGLYYPSQYVYYTCPSKLSITYTTPECNTSCGVAATSGFCLNQLTPPSKVYCLYNHLVQCPDGYARMKKSSTQNGQNNDCIPVNVALYSYTILSGFHLHTQLYKDTSPLIAIQGIDIDDTIELVLFNKNHVITLTITTATNLSTSPNTLIFSSPTLPTENSYQLLFTRPTTNGLPNNNDGYQRLVPMGTTNGGILDVVDINPCDASPIFEERCDPSPFLTDYCLLSHNSETNEPSSVCICRSIATGATCNRCLDNGGFGDNCAYSLDMGKSSLPTPFDPTIATATEMTITEMMRNTEQSSIHLSTSLLYPGQLFIFTINYLDHLEYEKEPCWIRLNDGGVNPIMNLISCDRDSTTQKSKTIPIIIAPEHLLSWSRSLDPLIPITLELVSGYNQQRYIVYSMAIVTNSCQLYRISNLTSECAIQGDRPCQWPNQQCSCESNFFGPQCQFRLSMIDPDLSHGNANVLNHDDYILYPKQRLQFAITTSSQNEFNNDHPSFPLVNPLKLRYTSSIWPYATTTFHPILNLNPSQDPLVIAMYFTVPDFNINSDDNDGGTIEFSLTINYETALTVPNTGLYQFPSFTRTLVNGCGEVGSYICPTNVPYCLPPQSPILQEQRTIPMCICNPWSMGLLCQATPTIGLGVNNILRGMSIASPILWSGFPWLLDIAFIDNTEDMSLYGLELSFTHSTDPTKVYKSIGVEIYHDSNQLVTFKMPAISATCIIKDLIESYYLDVAITTLPYKNYIASPAGLRIQQYHEEQEGVVIDRSQYLLVYITSSNICQDMNNDRNYMVEGKTCIIENTQICSLTDWDLPLNVPYSQADGSTVTCQCKYTYFGQTCGLKWEPRVDDLWSGKSDLIAIPNLSSFQTQWDSISSFTMSLVQVDLSPNSFPTIPVDVDLVTGFYDIPDGLDDGMFIYQLDMVYRGITTTFQTLTPVHIQSSCARHNVLMMNDDNAQYQCNIDNTMVCHPEYQLPLQSGQVFCICKPGYWGLQCQYEMNIVTSLSFPFDHNQDALLILYPNRNDVNLDTQASLSSGGIVSFSINLVPLIKFINGIAVLDINASILLVQSSDVVNDLNFQSTRFNLPFMDLSLSPSLENEYVLLWSYVDINGYNSLNQMLLFPFTISSPTAPPSTTPRYIVKMVNNCDFLSLQENNPLYCSLPNIGLLTSPANANSNTNYYCDVDSYSQPLSSLNGGCECKIEQENDNKMVIGFGCEYLFSIPSSTPPSPTLPLLFYPDTELDVIIERLTELLPNETSNNDELVFELRLKSDPTVILPLLYTYHPPSPSSQTPSRQTLLFTQDSFDNANLSGYNHGGKSNEYELVVVSAHERFANTKTTVYKSIPTFLIQQNICGHCNQSNYDDSKSSECLPLNTYQSPITTPVCPCKDGYIGWYCDIEVAVNIPSFGLYNQYRDIPLELLHWDSSQLSSPVNIVASATDESNNFTFELFNQNGDIIDLVLSEISSITGDVDNLQKFLSIDNPFNTPLTEGLYGLRINYHFDTQPMGIPMTSIILPLNIALTNNQCGWLDVMKSQIVCNPSTTLPQQCSALQYQLVLKQPEAQTAPICDCISTSWGSSCQYHLLVDSTMWSSTQQGIILSTNGGSTLLIQSPSLYRDLTFSLIQDPSPQDDNHQQYDPIVLQYTFVDNEIILGLPLTNTQIPTNTLWLLQMAYSVQYQNLSTNDQVTLYSRVVQSSQVINISDECQLLIHNGFCTANIIGCDANQVNLTARTGQLCQCSDGYFGDRCQYQFAVHDVDGNSTLNLQWNRIISGIPIKLTMMNTIDPPTLEITFNVIDLTQSEALSPSTPEIVPLTFTLTMTDIDTYIATVNVPRTTPLIISHQYSIVMTWKQYDYHHTTFIPLFKSDDGPAANHDPKFSLPKQLITILDDCAWLQLHQQCQSTLPNRNRSCDLEVYYQDHEDRVDPICKCADGYYGLDCEMGITLSSLIFHQHQKFIQLTMTSSLSPSPVFRPDHISFKLIKEGHGDIDIIISTGLELNEMTYLSFNLLDTSSSPPKSLSPPLLSNEIVGSGTGVDTKDGYYSFVMTYQYDNIIQKVVMSDKIEIVNDCDYIQLYNLNIHDSNANKGCINHNGCDALQYELSVTKQNTNVICSCQDGFFDTYCSSTVQLATMEWNRQMDNININVVFNNYNDARAIIPSMEFTLVFVTTTDGDAHTTPITSKHQLLIKSRPVVFSDEDDDQSNNGLTVTFIAKLPQAIPIIPPTTTITSQQLILSWGGWGNSLTLYDATLSEIPIIIEDLTWLIEMNICSPTNTINGDIIPYLTFQHVITTGTPLPLLSSWCHCKDGYYSHDCAETVTFDNHGVMGLWRQVKGIMMTFSLPFVTTVPRFHLHQVINDENNESPVIELIVKSNDDNKIFILDIDSHGTLPIIGEMYKLAFTYNLLDQIDSTHAANPTTQTAIIVPILSNQDYLSEMGLICSLDNTNDIVLDELYTNQQNYCQCKGIGNGAQYQNVFGKQCEFSKIEYNSMDYNNVFTTLSASSSHKIEVGSRVQFDIDINYYQSLLQQKQGEDGDYYYIISLFSSTSPTINNQNTAQFVSFLHQLDDITKNYLDLSFILPGDSTPDDSHAVMTMPTVEPNNALYYFIAIIPLDNTNNNDNNDLLLNWLTNNNDQQSVTKPSFTDINPRYISPSFKLLWPKMTVSSVQYNPSDVNENTEHYLTIQWIPPTRSVTHHTTVYHSFYIVPTNKEDNIIPPITSSFAQLTASITIDHVRYNDLVHIPETFRDDITINLPQVMSSDEWMDGFSIIIIPSKLPDNIDLSSVAYQPIMFTENKPLGSLCDTMTCLNNGVCNGYIGKCICPDGYHGDQCEIATTSTTSPQTIFTQRKQCSLKCPHYMSPSNDCQQCICTTELCGRLTRVTMLYFKEEQPTNDNIQQQSTHFLSYTLPLQLQSLFYLNQLPTKPTLYTSHIDPDDYTDNGRPTIIGLESITTLPLVVNGTDLNAVALFITIKPFDSTVDETIINNRFDYILEKLSSERRGLIQHSSNNQVFTMDKYKEKLYWNFNTPIITSPSSVQQILPYPIWYQLYRDVVLIQSTKLTSGLTLFLPSSPYESQKAQESQELLHTVCKHNSSNLWSRCFTSSLSSSQWPSCSSQDTSTPNSRRLTIGCLDYANVTWLSDHYEWCRYRQYPSFPSVNSLDGACSSSNMFTVQSSSSPFEQVSFQSPLEEPFSLLASSLPTITQVAISPSVSIQAGQDVIITWVYSGEKINTISIYLTGVDISSTPTSATLLQTSPLLLGIFSAIEQYAIIKIPLTIKPTFNADFHLMVTQNVMASTSLSSHMPYYYVIAEPRKDYCENVTCHDNKAKCNQYTGKCGCPDGYYVPYDPFNLSNGKCQLKCQDKCLNGGECRYNEQEKISQCVCPMNQNGDSLFHGDHCQYNTNCLAKGQTLCHSQGVIVTNDDMTCSNTCQCDNYWSTPNDSNNNNINNQCTECSLLSSNGGKCDSLGTDNAKTITKNCQSCECLRGYSGGRCDLRSLYGTISFQKHNVLAIPSQNNNDDVSILLPHQLPSIDHPSLETTQEQYQPITTTKTLTDISSNIIVHLRQDIALSLNIAPQLVKLIKVVETTIISQLSVDTQQETIITKMVFEITSSTTTISSLLLSSSRSLLTLDGNKNVLAVINTNEGIIMDDLYSQWSLLQNNYNTLSIGQKSNNIINNNNIITTKFGSIVVVFSAYDPNCVALSNCPKGTDPFIGDIVEPTTPVTPPGPDDEGNGSDNDDKKGKSSLVVIVCIVVVVVLLIIMAIIIIVVKCGLCKKRSEETMTIKDDPVTTNHIAPDNDGGDDDNDDDGHDTEKIDNVAINTTDSTDMTDNIAYIPDQHEHPDQSNDNVNDSPGSGVEVAPLHQPVRQGRSVRKQSLSS